MKNFLNKVSEKIDQLKMNPPLVLVIGFALLILCGGLLLNLSVVTKSGQSIGFINALFTAGSASCVTGLVVVNTANYWNWRTDYHFDSNPNWWARHNDLSNNVSTNFRKKNRLTEQTNSQRTNEYRYL